MFRRLESTLPPDFEFPTTLSGLGYFINSQDQIRMVDDPEQPFNYFASRNERYVERQKEAMTQCIRDILYERLNAQGLKFTPLPLGTPAHEPHIPIWMSENIQTCKRLLVYVGESNQDLGVFAGRIINGVGINEGSAVKFVQEAHRSHAGELPEDQKPGILIANPGQLLWHRGSQKAMSWPSWYALKRRSAVSPGYEVTDQNRVPRNEDVREHIGCFFEDVVLPQGQRKCDIFVIAVGDTAVDVFDYLQANWDVCKNKLHGLAILTSNRVWQSNFYDQNFQDWFGRRARGYLVSDAPPLAPLQGRSVMGCNLYSSGEPQYIECIMHKAQVFLLDHFKLISFNPMYANDPQNIDPPKDAANGAHASEERVEGWGDGVDESNVPLEEASGGQGPISEVGERLKELHRDTQGAAPTTEAGDAQERDTNPTIDLYSPRISSQPLDRSLSPDTAYHSAVDTLSLEDRSEGHDNGYTTPPEDARVAQQGNVSRISPTARRASMNNFTAGFAPSVLSVREISTLHQMESTPPLPPAPHSTPEPAPRAAPTTQEAAPQLQIDGLDGTGDLVADFEETLNSVERSGSTEPHVDATEGCPENCE